ncbi:lac repressor [Bythopirellula polymerisocia]|uniref:Lac repressor n=2 Tax=Bythopirellula polymerisocia TaxID=2528003 RepID=A0A5C6CQW1_9BACT|nr:lac repressor [Bythopirellula polymerisocia]
MTVIERRIREGDYLLDSIPGERKIAEETGVSYMTARRAVLKLIDNKVLIRDTSGSLGIHPSYVKRAKPAEVVLLYPAYPSTYLTQLRGLVSDFAEKRGIRLRPAQFVHWDEKTVLEAAAQARGTFVIPHGPGMPARLIEAFRENKVVILDGDFSSEGLPSIRLFSDSCVEEVLEHLYRLGHRHIDCVNTQNRNPEIERRIDIWQCWLKERRLKGQLWDKPAAEFTDPTIVSYNLAARLVDEQKVKSTAMICTTCPAAIGMMRACWERDIRVGKDLSICSVNIEPPAEFFCPSITGLKLPDLSDVLEKCVNWMFSTKSYHGSHLLEPNEPALFEGESTAKPIRRSSSRLVELG